LIKPIAVVIGGVGKLPYAGMSLYYLHHVTGLQKLGYEVHYVERQNRSHECYDPRTGTMTDEPGYALRYLADILPRFGIDSDHYSFIDRADECFGSGWERLRMALDHAAFVLTVADPTWFDELERCSRRLYIDGDPMFTQVAMATGRGTRAEAATHYDCLFTYATRIDQPGCTVPAAGRQWIGTRPVVDTASWSVAGASRSLPVTAVMHWAAGADLEFEGRTYGHKDREFEQFIDLPRRARGSFRLAVGGGRVPRARLEELGWNLVDPLRHTQRLEDFRALLSGSSADFGVAKNAYVASQSGWFSDRSTCFLASGRPVLHQDTGCGDWLPAGKGVLLFSDMDSLLEALASLDADYEEHARAARSIAEEHFEASAVLDRMLQAGGLR